MSPLFFPGGDIGTSPSTAPSTTSRWRAPGRLYLSAAFILEEGFPLADWGGSSLHERGGGAAGVLLVTGDTKVVDRGKADGCFINTTGVGIVPDGVELSRSPRPGDP